jgi:hypothetical protein
MTIAMVALLPSDSDWDRIVELTGDKSWEVRYLELEIQHLTIYCFK